MTDHPDPCPFRATWDAFLIELKSEILPVYYRHETTFDTYSIHGRMHICRCLLFSEFMMRYHHQHIAPIDRPVWVRYAVAFHDSGREGNGIDIWEPDSARLCATYLANGPLREDANAIGQLITKGGYGDYGIEKRMVHDADVLDIMRPVCGHGGREGFRKSALRFLSRERTGDPERISAIRDTLIEEAWHFIQVTEDLKFTIFESADYMNDVADVMRRDRSQYPLLTEYLL